MDTQSTKEVASAHAAHREREHFFSAAKVVAGLTLLSRILGMIRQMSIVWLGAKWENSAFQVAFTLPNLFRRLFGEGALSAAFVPVFTETLEKGGMDKARRLLANAMALLAVFLLCLMLLVQAGLLVWLWLSPPERKDTQFLVLLTSITLPYMVLVCLLALGSAVLNCRGHFAYPAAAPIILNVFMIAADGVAWFFWPGREKSQLITLSASIALAGVVQLWGVLWLLKRSGFQVRLRLRPVEGGVRQILKLMAPTLLGMGFLQLTSLFDVVVQCFFSGNQFTSTINIFGRQIHRPLDEGVLVCVSAAQMLYQFPMGMLAISLGVAVFPLLSRYASRGDMGNFRDSLNRAIRLAILEGLATGVGLFVLADPIVRLLYQHGNFSAARAAEAAYILQMYVLGMWAYCTYQIFLRAFYSLKSPNTPMKVSCTLAVLYMALVLGLIWVPSINSAAFGLAAAITFSINALVLSIILRRRLGRFGGRQLAVSALRSAVAAGLMAATIWSLRSWMESHGYGNLKVVAACVPAGVVVFVAVAAGLQAPELGELFGAIRRKAAVPETPTDAV